MKVEGDSVALEQVCIFARAASFGEMLGAPMAPESVEVVLGFQLSEPSGFMQDSKVWEPHPEFIPVQYPLEVSLKGLSKFTPGVQVLGGQLPEF